VEEVLEFKECMENGILPLEVGAEGLKGFLGLGLAT
jgi:hypothetical protein